VTVKTPESCFVSMHTSLCTSSLVIQARQRLVFCVQAWRWHVQEHCEGMPAANNPGGLDSLCCKVSVLLEGQDEAKSREN